METTTKILTIDITNVTYRSAVSIVLKKAIDQESGFFCFANTHMAVEALSNRELSESLGYSEMIFADGFPIAKSIKLIYNVKQERIAGMGFFPDMLKVSDDNSLRIFLLGSTEKVLSLTESKIKREFPNITIVGAISPPFDKKWDNEKFVCTINESEPNIVYVSLGCPKQEIWMAQNYKSISAPLLGIGGAITVYAGVLKRAPLILQKFGFEWLFRLLQEPRRLAKRYFYTNTVFLFYIFKAWLNKKNEEVGTN